MFDRFLIDLTSSDSFLYLVGGSLNFLIKFAFVFIILEATKILGAKRRTVNFFVAFFVVAGQILFDAMLQMLSISLRIMPATQLMIFVTVLYAVVVLYLWRVSKALFWLYLCLMIYSIITTVFWQFHLYARFFEILGVSNTQKYRVDINYMFFIAMCIQIGALGALMLARLIWSGKFTKYLEKLPKFFQISIG